MYLQFRIHNVWSPDAEASSAANEISETSLPLPFRSKTKLFLFIIYVHDSHGAIKEI